MCSSTCGYKEKLKDSLTEIWARPCIRPVVLNLVSIEPQGFVESVSGVRQRSRILRLFSTIPFLAEKVKTFIHKHFKTYSFFSNILCATDEWFILCTNKIYTYDLEKSYFIFGWMHWWSLQGSVPPIRLRATALEGIGPLDQSLDCNWSNQQIRIFRLKQVWGKIPHFLLITKLPHFPLTTKWQCNLQNSQIIFKSIASSK